MYLRALNIKGFKSFARKTVFEFEPGLTIIVGPNGSGKSNIADAITWVLGEQSPTSLRGNRMEDVIFSGSASVRPVNMAEVAVTLDNSNNDFPLDVSEINISRNVVRGGDSEYRINNSSCRLLDIQELLSDAGVGRTLNSVVGQNQLEEILNCRPERRRDYIEEAGGLLKYRRRREKASRRLERTEESLARVSDIKREVRRQLKPLRDQAGRLERYQSLNKELEETRLRLDATVLRGMKSEWDVHERSQVERRDKLARLEGELRGATGNVRRLEEEEEAWRAEEIRLRDCLYRAVSVHERLKAMLPVTEEKVRPRGPDADSSGRSLERIAGENQSLELDLETRTSRVEELRSAERALRVEIEEARSEHSKLARARMEKQARLEVLTRDDEDGRRPGLADERLRERVAALRAEALEEENILSGLRTEAEAHHGAGEGPAERIERLLARRAAVAQELRRAEAERSRLLATLDILSRLETKAWGVLNATGRLLAEDPTHGGLGSTLGQSMNVDPGCEVAVLSFLGPWAYGIEARDRHNVKTAIRYLKDNDLGQSLFFVPGRARDRQPAGGGVEPAGAIRAREVVSATGTFAEALDDLFEGVFLAEDLDRAFELGERYPELVFLSPDGDVVSGRTVIKGGSPGVDRAHIDMTRAGRDRMEDELERCSSAIDELELEEKALASSEEETAAGIARQSGAGADIAGEIEARSASVAALRARAEEIEKILESVEDSSPDDTRSRIEQLRGEMRELERGERLLAETLAELERREGETETRLREAQAGLAAAEKVLQMGKNREGELRAALRELRRHGTGTPGEQVEAGKLLEANRRLSSMVERIRRGLLESIKGGEENARRSSVELRTVREEVSAVQRRHDELLEEIHTEDLKRAELKIMVEQLVERIVDGHQVPLEYALEHYAAESVDPALEERVEKLASQLEHIGPVNPEAITEKRALEERYEFLEREMEDVQETRKRLSKVIRQIDKEIKQRFKSTLDEVDRNFQQMFAFLFPNGKAQLMLTDPDDLLATGVEIMAQPEGKKLRRISLLSGGETSMTALAFLFALFKVRPSPFYFLDEVEAALDDINLHRFLELVKRFKGESQLILITHQKRSMEIADILYGVSMQDDGVSRVVSQKVAV